MVMDADEVRRTYAALAQPPIPDVQVRLTVSQRAALDCALRAPAMGPLLRDITVRVSARREPLCLHGRAGLEIGESTLVHPASAVFHLRHGVEQLTWGNAARDATQMAAARLLALHSSLLFLEDMNADDRARVLSAAPAWLAAALGEVCAARAQPNSAPLIVGALARSLPHLQAFGSDPFPGSVEVTDAASSRVAAALAIAQPTERLLTLGGDERLLVSPDTRLNRYGCSPSPRPWAITFSTCTASSISAPGFERAEAQRRRLFSAAVAGRLAEGFGAEMAQTRARLGTVLRVDRIPGVRVLLAPSGTDAELFAVYCAATAADRPLLNILVAPREIGSGSRYAAAGRHFDRMTPLGGAVEPGAVVEELPGDRIRVRDLELRDESGRALPDAQVEVRLRGLVREGIEAGETVLVHLLDSSKTGLGAPGLECLADLQSTHGDRIAVIVDAAQMRVSRANIAEYLRHGFFVLTTGSKFFTGPPFSGALLIPPAIAAAVERAGPFPRGLGCYASRWEVPEEWRGQAVRFPTSPNYGLLLRWQAALWEMDAFFAADSATRYRIFRDFAGALQRRMDTWSCIEPLPPSVYRRTAGAQSESWDSVPSIFSFLVRRRSGWLSYDDAVMAYHWLNTDLAGCLPPEASAEERRLAGRCGHIGQPVRIRIENGVWLGALRIAPGARLVSRICFDPSIGDDPAERLAQQVDAACTVLDKLDLICEYWEFLVEARGHEQNRWPLAATAAMGADACH